MKTEPLLDHATILATRPGHFALRLTADEVVVAAHRPAAFCVALNLCIPVLIAPRQCKNWCLTVAPSRGNNPPRNNMSYDTYQHDILSALAKLAESPAMEPTMTWDGANNYQIQPAEKYTPFDSDHRAILTKSALESYCDGDLSADALSTAVAWVESNQREWFDADES